MLASLVEEFGSQGALTSAEAKAQFSSALSALVAQMRPANRLRGFIRNNVSALLGDGAPAGFRSPQELLRQSVGDRPWRSNAASASAPLQYNQASLWQRLDDAAALAPHKAARSLQRSLLSWILSLQRRPDLQDCST